mgnify:CR=1 FL=1
MRKTEFIQLIEKPELINEEAIHSIKKYLNENPYFQTGQLLLLKGLLNTNSVEYNTHLRKTAAYIYDRKKLFEFITLGHKKKHNLQQPLTNKKEKDNTNKGDLLKFDQDEMYSFSEWLKLSKVKKIRKNKTINEVNNLVNDFVKEKKNMYYINKDILNNPGLTLENSLIENDEIITPTLAKVYLEQGHLEKAIIAYKKLSLKYPEKNSFFANQIKLITKLKTK